jgi:uncharacterized protein
VKKLVPFDIVNAAEPVLSSALAERLIEGHPSYKTWEMDRSEDSVIRSGMWEATPGATRSIKGTTWEFCVIISGVVEMTEEGGDTRRFTAGDVFVMKPGFVGVWKTIETVRKWWVTVTPKV